MRYAYFGKAAAESAELKRMMRETRARRPELFVPRELRTSQMDGEGRVTVQMHRDVRAVGLSGRDRHEFARRKV